MNRHHKLFRLALILTLLAGVIAFATYAPEMFNNVAWNSGHAWVPDVVPANVAWNSRIAWYGGEDLPMPNVAWNSRVAWTGDGRLPMPNVAWNSGVAWIGGEGLPVPKNPADWESVFWRA
jgi:hypothetical protein